MGIVWPPLVHAGKVICNDKYSNKSRSVIALGMLQLREINQMERAMCQYLEGSPVMLKEFDHTLLFFLFVSPPAICCYFLSTPPTTMSVSKRQPHFSSTLKGRVGPETRCHAPNVFGTVDMEKVS